MNSLVSRIHSFNSSPKNDATIDVTFVIHDFELSGNGQVVTEEECMKNMHTLINKPILAKYYEEEDEDSLDHFGDHEVVLTINRDTKELMFSTDTVAIGVCTKPYIDEVEGRRCLLADGVLWSDRYYNACSLLYEWYSRGIRTKSSCEYLYSNYDMRGGVQYIKSDIIYEGITILNSEERGDAEVVAPAYESSHMLSFNSALGQDLNNINANKGTQKEVLNMAKGDGKVEDVIKEVEPEVVPEVTPAVEPEVTPEVEAEKSINEEGADILDPVVEPEATPEVQEEGEGDIQVEMIELSKYQEMEEELGKLKAELEEVKSAKCELAEEVVSLNTTIATLSVYKEKADKENYETALNEKKEFYREKFEKFGANELFGTDEVQALIEKCLNEEEEKEARLALSEMLITTGTSFNSVVKSEVEKPVVELATPMKDLVNKTNKFKEIYGFEK